MFDQDLFKENLLNTNAAGNNINKNGLIIAITGSISRMDI